jgi:hypothetical protein
MMKQTKQSPFCQYQSVERTCCAPSADQNFVLFMFHRKKREKPLTSTGAKRLCLLHFLYKMLLQKLNINRLLPNRRRASASSMTFDILLILSSLLRAMSRFHVLPIDGANVATVDTCLCAPRGSRLTHLK